MYSLWQLEIPQLRAQSLPLTASSRHDDIAGKDGFHRLIIPSSASSPSQPPFSLQATNDTNLRTACLVVAANGHCGVRFIPPAKSLRFT